MNIRGAIAVFAAMSAPVLGAVESVSEVCSTNVFGVLPVYSASVRTIVSVPWVACGSGETAVEVAKLVSPANLTEGDFCCVYSGGSFYGFVLEDGAWQEAKNVSNVAGLSETSTLARGGALILCRQNPSAVSPFYVRGQVGVTSNGVATVVAAGTVESPVYTLLAPPRVSGAWSVSDLKFTGNVSSNDQIVVIDPSGKDRPLTWRDGKGWCVKNPTWKAYTGTTPAGVGCWYVSKGGNPTVDWQSVVPVVSSVP